jgi:S-formylglutathione hydrolase FrmB
MAFMECHFTSKVLDLSVSVNLLVPDDLQEGEKLKVLYLLHGYMGNHTDWMRYTSIERYLWNHRMIVVMPSAMNSYYADMVYGMPFFTFISSELPKFIERLLPISKKREDRFICGLSMGGYGAFKVALTYPDAFAYAGSLSGALDVESVRKMMKDTPRARLYDAMFGQFPIEGSPNDLFHLVEKNTTDKQKMPHFYMACGTEDFLYQDNLRFKHHLKKHHADFTYVEGPGDHSWAFWDEYILKFLEHIKQGR